MKALFFATMFALVSFAATSQTVASTQAPLTVKMEDVTFTKNGMVLKMPGAKKLRIEDPNKLTHGYVLTEYQTLTIVLDAATNKWIVTHFNCAC